MAFKNCLKKLRHQKTLLPQFKKFLKVIFKNLRYIQTFYVKVLIFYIQLTT